MECFAENQKWNKWFFIGIKGDKLEVEIEVLGNVLLKKETWSKRNRAGQVVGSPTEYPLSFFFILATIAIPVSKETACFPSLSNTALRSLKSHRSGIAVMKTCFLKTLPYFVLKEEIFTFKFSQFELRLVNENNADKSAFARVGSKGIDVNESKRLSPNPSVSYLSLRPCRYLSTVTRSSSLASVDVFTQERLQRFATFNSLSVQRSLN